MRPSNRTGELARRCLALGVLLLAAGCNRSSDDEGFVVYSTWHTASTDIEPFVGGTYLVYWIDEAKMGVSGIDYNGNGETDDQTTFLMDVTSGYGWYPGLAALEAFVLNNNVFLVADESIEHKDLNMDGDEDDLVLEYWRQADASLTNVDTLDPDTGAPYAMIAGNRLWYAAEAPSLTGDETSLRWVDTTDVFAVQEVPNQPGAGTLRPRLLSGFRDLPLLVLDETVEGRNLNATGGLGTDVDMLDQTVLAVVDLADPAVPLVRNTELALASKAAPTWAVSLGGSPQDWLLTFLVSESDQGGEDLDDPGLFDPNWVLPQCGAMADGDTSDQVQFFVEYQSWLAGDTGIVNTGLAGVDRALAVDGYVGCLSDEMDAACDLNQDGDFDDTVFRWTSIADPIVPPAMLPLHAVALLPDESSGASPLATAFLIAVDELADNADHNGDGVLDAVLLAQNEPATASVWTFYQNDPKTAVQTVGVDFMAPYSKNSSANLLPTSLMEAERDENLNVTCSANHDDGDKTDVLPVWGRWDPNTHELTVAGYAFAAQSGNGGMVMWSGLFYFRLSEAEQGSDVNGDGDMTDYVLYRAPTTTCAPVMMADANALPGEIVFSTEGAQGACFYGDETLSGIDYNRDGDTLDIVVRWFEY